MSSSRFARPTYASQTSSNPVNNYVKSWTPIKFNVPKTVDERRAFKPFGKATDVIANKNITTIGDDIFMEYKPIMFLGPSGMTYVNNYINDIINAVKNNTALTYNISIQTDDIVQPLTMNGDNSTQMAPYNWDWWGDDDINNKINTLECHNIMSTQTVGTKHSYAYLYSDVISDIVDKLSIAQKLIKEFNVPITNNDKTIKFREINNAVTSDTKQQSRFIPKALRTSQNTNQSGEYLSSNSTSVIHDDNWSIRISNFTDTNNLNQSLIRDLLSEYLGDVKYKISIPRDKETNTNKDFAFLNFNSECDMNTALSTLTSQRIYFDSAILYIEQSKRKSNNNL